jgi:glycosyltransferase involved in cell wall biosynthesis
MRIGINCISLDKNYAGGINTFTFGLLDGFARVRGMHSFIVFVNSDNQPLFQRWTGVSNFKFVTVGAGAIKMRKLLRRFSVVFGSAALYRWCSNFLFNSVIQLMDDQCDLIYTPTTVLLSYNSRAATVLSMHDIQQYHFPGFFSWNERAVRRLTYPLSTQFATHLQASSDFVKRDLLEHFHALSEEKITVIPEGVDIEAFSRHGETAAPHDYAVPDRFLFFPAQLWPHKNHITVLKALRRLRDESGLIIPLVLTGADYSAAPAIREFIKTNSMDFVHLLGKVPFEMLVSLYHRAAFLITAVLYESSSLPVLEAAASGTPIIASRTPPNEQLGSILRLNLFAPHDDVALAELLLQLWSDPTIGALQAKYNSEHVAYYSWENAAIRYLALFETVTSARIA